MMVLLLATLGAQVAQVAKAQEENFTGNMVKMCLFYPNPSGHARSDPIISQTCAADHVHSVSIIYIKYLFIDAVLFVCFFSVEYCTCTQYRILVKINKFNIW